MFRKVILFSGLLFLVFIFYLKYSDTRNTKDGILDDKNKKNIIKESIETLSDGIIQHPSKPDLYYKRGLIFYNKKNYERAVYDFRNANILDDLDIHYKIYLGVSLYKYHHIPGKELDKTALNNALLLFNNILKDDTICNYDNHKQGEYNSYKKIITEALKFRCKIHILYLDYDNAFFDINRLEHLLPLDYEVYYLKGCIFEKTNRIDEAIYQYHRSISINSNHFYSYFRLGKIYQEKNDSIFVDYYNKALKIDSNRTGLLYNIAKYYQDNRMFDNSIKFYNKILRVDKFNESANYSLGYIYFYSADYTKAANYFSDAIYSNPNNYDAYRNRSWCFRKLDRIEEADRDSLKWMSIKNSIQN